MELRWLRALIAIADAGSFVDAATRLGLSQPTISGYIGSLERTLKKRLVNRTKRPVQLTPAGQTFVRYARLAVANVDVGASSVMGGSPRSTLEPVHVGTYASATSGFIPQVFAAATKEHPEVDIILREMSGHAMVRASDRGEIDLFIRQSELPAPDKLFASLPLWREAFKVVLPQGHPWERYSLTGLPPEELLHRSFIMTGSGEPETASEHPLWKALGGYPLVHHRVIHPQSLFALVDIGIAPGLTTELAVAAFHTESSFIRIDHPLAYREVRLYWRKDLTMTAGIATAIDVITSNRQPHILTPDH